MPMDFNTENWLGVDIPPVKITVNADYSVTYTQEIPATTREWDYNEIPMPEIDRLVIGFVKGSGVWSTLAVLPGGNLGGQTITWTSQPCLLDEEVQYAGGCGVVFKDPYYVQGTGFSTNFWRSPGWTYQGGETPTGSDITPTGCTGTTEVITFKGKPRKKK